MKRFLILALLIFVVLGINIGCRKEKKSAHGFPIADIDTMAYKPFGAKITKDSVLYGKNLARTYTGLEQGDTVAITFMGTVNDVCKAKGCWMKVSVDGNMETMVKFKEYGFFVPKDIENDTVIVQGKAFVDNTTVEELRHYAADAGKSGEEISKINQPIKTYSFVASGVLIKK